MERGGEQAARTGSRSSWLHQWFMASSGLRYLVTGAVLFFFDLGIYTTLHVGLLVGVMTSQLISRTAGAALGFLGHKYVSFGGSGGKQVVSAAGQGVAYAIVMAGNILVSPLLVALVVSLVGLVIGAGATAAVVGKVISDAILIVETYLLLRLIFRAEG